MKSLIAIATLSATLLASPAHADKKAECTNKVNYIQAIMYLYKSSRDGGFDRAPDLEKADEYREKVLSLVGEAQRAGCYVPLSIHLEL